MTGRNEVGSTAIPRWSLHANAVDRGAEEAIVQNSGVPRVRWRLQATFEPGGLYPMWCTSTRCHGLRCRLACLLERSGDGRAQPPFFVNVQHVSAELTASEAAGNGGAVEFSVRKHLQQPFLLRKSQSMVKMSPALRCLWPANIWPVRRRLGMAATHIRCRPGRPGR